MNLLLLFLFAAVRPVLGRRASIVLFESGCEIWVIVVADLQGDIGDRGVRLAQKADSQIHSCLYDILDGLVNDILRRGGFRKSFRHTVRAAQPFLAIILQSGRSDPALHNFQDSLPDTFRRCRKKDVIPAVQMKRFMEIVEVGMAGKKNSICSGLSNRKPMKISSIGMTAR